MGSSWEPIWELQTSFNIGGLYLSSDMQTQILNKMLRGADFTVQDVDILSDRKSG